MSDRGVRLAVALGRLLRDAGVAVPGGAVAGFAAALDAVGLDDRSAAYWAGRATLVTAPEDAPAYDAAFAAFFGGSPERHEHVVDPIVTTLVIDDGDEEEGGGGERREQEPAGSTLAQRFSRSEILRHRDLATCTAEELAEAFRLMAGVRFGGALRRSRRLRPQARRRGRPDLRRTVRAAVRAGGEPVRPARREATVRPRRVVLLVDVSGSMEPYARALLRFAHSAVVGRRQVEAFTLGTRLTRVTRELASRDPDAALDAAAGAVPDWAGGTRLGDGLAEFASTWGVRGMARGAVVVVLSDGWERGDTTVLAGALARLQRVAHKVVWVNPLKASPGYAPLAAGMAAALPYVDESVEGHSLASLEDLVGVIAR
ncbi:MAG: VWA domain-containing protein [Acidimicrobiales bacterium]